MTDEKALLALAERFGQKLAEAFVANIRRALEAGAEVTPNAPPRRDLEQLGRGLFPASPPEDSVVCRIPLSDGSELPVTRPIVAEWAKAYPAVDVAQTLQEIRVWALTPENRTQLWTRKGAPRGVNRWLANEQNRIAREQARAAVYRGNGDGRKG